MTTPRVTLSGDGAAPRPLAVLRAPRQGVRRLRGFVGRHLSIRLKLTIWYTLMYAITLVVIGFALPHLLQLRTQADIDAGLRQSAAGLTAQARRLPVSGPKSGSATSTGAQSQCLAYDRSYCAQLSQMLNVSAGTISRPGQFAQILVVDDRAGINAVPLAPSNIPFINFNQMYELFLQLGSVRVSSGVSIYQDVTYKGVSLRLFATRLPVPREVERRNGLAILEVYQPVVSYAETQHSLTIILLGLSPLVLALALLLGWWIARAALRPIGRISRTVQTIGTSRDLGRRLDFVGPRDEVGRLADTFDSMMDRLEETFEGQKQFIADASHELRTPLTAIRGNADLLRIAPADERDACLTAIQREAERMSRLVSDLLHLAEADVAQHPIHKRQVDLAPILEEVYRSARVLAGDRVAVSLEIKETVVVLADADRIKQLLLNLADNAVKFTPEGGLVSLTLRQDGKRALIDVKDTGVGIAPAEQEAIFRRFYRVDKSRSTRGTGLGLSISAWIVQAHDGDLELKSEPGLGSTFTVCLPLPIPERKKRRTKEPSSHPADYAAHSRSR